MDLIRKPYEISLWEDILTFVYEDGKETEGKVENGHGAVTAQYYKERKICIIGSNTMNTPIRAVNGKIKSNVNGSNELTFDMYSHYYDEESDELITNPFINLLINERKVKLRYGELGAPDTKWYDLIIKRISENSETKVFNYTAQDLFINELSKSGFNLEFDQELENNTGNIKQLANAILAESDWKLKEGECDLLRQTIEEPLYKITLGSSITPIDMISGEEASPLNADTEIYGFYNCIANRTPFFQFLYADEYKVDDDHIIISESNWYVDDVEYDEEGVPDFVKRSADENNTPFMVISDEYRGKRLVRKIKTHYDASIDKYVGVYKNTDSPSAEIYGYTETSYSSPAAVRSFVTNGTEFTNTTGWEFGGTPLEESTGIKFPTLEVVSVPDIREVNYEDDNFSIQTYLKFDVTKVGQKLFNSGIADHRQHINGFSEGEEFIFRVKYGVEVNDELYFQMYHGEGESREKVLPNLKFYIADYTMQDGVYSLGTEYFNGTINSSSQHDEETKYFYIKVTCGHSLSYSNMIKTSLGLFIEPRMAKSVYIEDVQFFRYTPVRETTTDAEGTEVTVTRPLLPDEIWTDSQVQETYYFYAPNPEYKSIDDVDFIYQGETIPDNIVPAYNDGDGYEKVRSITEKESNRFNLIQKLCETFECWPKFEIDHDPQTGRILVDEQYRQRKWVSFREYVGKDNYAGFKYGINLKGITRDIDSETIASKVIVKNNANEFGRDGFCSIARALENPSGENYILDFSYYIQHGLLTLSQVTNDLYSNFNGYIGFYTALRRINKMRDQYIEEQAQLFTDLADYQANVTTYSTLLNEAEEQKRDQLVYVKSLTGKTASWLLSHKTDDWWENDKVIETMTSIARLNSIIPKYRNYKEIAEENLTNAQNQYDWLNRVLSSVEESEDEPRLLLQKQQLNQCFYQKYSRFLQEGSWISEDYIDDELYYLDACGTARTSSKPQITYTIQVLEISQLEGYENYSFSVGDKTTMEDTEFFGWVVKNGLRTPYREEVIVSETTIALDSPEQNEIKVQNYKTQFEDLFQRMAATTQSIEYHTGEYNKVSSIVEPNGTIEFAALQNSIANNALILSGIADDQSVDIGLNGITTTSPKNPAEIVRIVSGGIFLSADGGSTWNTGITGKGINANYLTSGAVNTDKISIMNGSFPSFRWDGFGLSAYQFELDGNTPVNFNYNQFVRLDQYGLYGILGNTDFIPNSEQDVRDNASFALTWKGFSLKSTHEGGGRISITSDNDFEVINNNNITQVKIGYLGKQNQGGSEVPVYGLRLSDVAGLVTMEQTSDGSLWLRKELNIGTASTSTIAIGYLGLKEEETKHRVFDANNKFVVYEDGSMRATDGYFQGEINATSGYFEGEINALGGQIGGVSIESIVGSSTDYDIRIESNSGTVFKNGVGSKILTARVYRGFKEIVNNLSYQWYKDDTMISGANSKTYSVTWTEEADDIEVTYSCKVTVGEVENG